MSKERNKHNEEFLKSRAGKSMLKEKVRELNFNRRLLLARKGQTLKKAMEEDDEEKKSWQMWLVKNMDEAYEEVVRKQKRFEFLLNRSVYGDKIFKRVDIGPAKEYPIASLMAEKPKYKTPEREKFLCPLHNENTPSFVWFKKENRFKCFGCGEYGDVIDLYKKLHGCDFMEAVNALLSVV